MANDILEDLFFGKVIPWEQRPDDIEECRNLNQKMSRTMRVLDEHLNKEAKALLDQYLSDQADMEALLSCDSFKTGFRLGVQLMLAVYKEP